MSILIKGMDMPKEMAEAESVDLIIYYNGNRFVKSIDPKRFVEIPTPHGRLIDADALDKELRRKWNYGDNGVTIANAPTILEAEEQDGIYK